MQCEHEEDGPSEQEKCRDEVGPLQTKPSYSPLTQYENKVEAGTMEYHEKNQHDCADTERRQRFKIIWNVGKE